jgi:hypothetical protein
MSLHSRGYRDSRRRRVLLEDSRLGSGSYLYEPPRSGKRKRYPNDALTDSQPYLTDLLPERKRSIGIIVGIACALVAVVMLLDWLEPKWSANSQPETWQFLRAFTPGSLACVLASALFALGAGVCQLIHFVRRRQLDDYLGTYRSWGVSAIALLVCGGLSLLPISSLVSLVLSRIPSIPESFTAQTATNLICATVAILLMGRWLVEVRRCRLAQTCFIAAAACGSGSLANVVKLFHLSSYQAGETVVQTLYFMAILCGLAGLLVYGRHVRLDAQGLILYVTSKRNSRRKGTVRRSPRTVVVEDDLGTFEDELDEIEEDELDESLSRAERRRLRRNAG